MWRYYWNYYITSTTSPSLGTTKMCIKVSAIQPPTKSVRTRGSMYKAVAQSVLLYGSKIWVATRDILKVLTTFRHWATRRITGMTAKHGAGVEWEYSAVEEAMESAGFRPIRVYIKRRHTTIAERVYCRPIYALCTESEQMTGTKRMVLWWDQDAINYPEEYTRKRCN